jgi:hypothetical protein
MAESRPEREIVLPMYFVVATRAHNTGVYISAATYGGAALLPTFPSDVTAGGVVPLVQRQAWLIFSMRHRGRGP